MSELGDEGFKWFFGVVEDVANDEHKLFRVRVRVINEHDGLATEELPWASVTLPTTSSTFDGASDTPAIAVGAMVFGFFADGARKQMPIVIATLPLAAKGGHSLSMLAMGEQILDKKLLGPEPTPTFAAQYPFNKVTTTRAGHVIEVDDTPGAERLHVYHKSGSYVEIGPDGTMVIKSAKDKYDVTTGNAMFYVTGECTIDAPTVKMTGDLDVQGDATIGGIKFSSHKHTGVQTGSSVTGAPQ